MNSKITFVLLLIAMIGTGMGFQLDKINVSFAPFDYFENIGKYFMWLIVDTACLFIGWGSILTLGGSVGFIDCEY